MDIYTKMYKKIVNLKYDTANRKIYKPILILSYIEYLKDYNCDFGTLVSIGNLFDYISIYIERDDLIPHLINDNDTDILELKNIKYRTYEKKIIHRFREQPLSKIINDNNDDTYFQTNLGINKPTSRRKKNLPDSFKIVIKDNFERSIMIDTISKACKELIYKISNIEINNDIVLEFNNNLENEFLNNKIYKFNDLDDSIQKVLITPRKGQNIYRKRLLEKFNNKCALCDIDIEEILIASHAKPWSRCENIHERLTSNNGLLLCPNHDKLFDKGLITIDIETNKILVSNNIDEYNTKKIITGINSKIKFNINDPFYKYITYHNNNIFQK